jgi:hypothetical protein
VLEESNPFATPRSDSSRYILRDFNNLVDLYFDGSAVALHKPRLNSGIASPRILSSTSFMIPQLSPANDRKRQFIPTDINASNAMLCMVTQMSPSFPVTLGQYAFFPSGGRACRHAGRIYGH